MEKSYKGIRFYHWVMIDSEGNVYDTFDLLEEGNFCPVNEFYTDLYFPVAGELKNYETKEFSEYIS